jgi:LacI family transcriptional regulator
MVTGRTQIIGFVLRQSPDQVFADRFLPQVLTGLSHAASAQGYHLMLEPIPLDAEAGAYTRLIRERHVDGIILSGPRSDDQDLLRIYSEGAPVVLMGRLPSTDIPFVDVDNVGGALTATRHLIELGHRRIGLITNADPEYTASADRLSGYRQALESAGLTYDQTLIRYGDFTPDGGDAAMSDLLQVAPRPTAIFIASDTVALGALRAIRRAGLHVPDDLAIVGFDDVPLIDLIDPPLTTVRLPAYGLGWGAADMLIRLIGKENIAQPFVTLETELIIRKSSGVKLKPC